MPKEYIELIGLRHNTMDAALMYQGDKDLRPRIVGWAPDDLLRYMVGAEPPRYPVPALWNCRWCAEPNIGAGMPAVCSYNGTGEWCPDCCIYFD